MARDVTSLGSVAVLGFLFFAVLGYLLLVRKSGAACLVLVAVGGGQLLSSILKLVFERQRPELVSLATRVFTASFPSGHALLSAVTYLTLGALLTRLHPNARPRVYIVSLAVFLTFAVGISRIYLGVHFPQTYLQAGASGLPGQRRPVTASDVLRASMDDGGSGLPTKSRIVLQ